MDGSVLTIRVEECSGRPEVLCVEIHGPIDLGTLPEVKKVLDPLMEAGRGVLLDCRGLRFISSTGLVLLLRYRSHVVLKGGVFKIVRLPDVVRRTLAVSGIDKLLEIHDTMEEALEGLGAK